MTALGCKLFNPINFHIIMKILSLRTEVKLVNFIDIIKSSPAMFLMINTCKYL